MRHPVRPAEGACLLPLEGRISLVGGILPAGAWTRASTLPIRPCRAAVGWTSHSPRCPFSRCSEVARPGRPALHLLTNSVAVTTVHHRLHMCTMELICLPTANRNANIRQHERGVDDSALRI